MQHIVYITYKYLLRLANMLSVRNRNGTNI